jgi:hypothetical protein
MQERAALFGGEFFISSQPGQGTLLEVVLPYGEREQGDVSTGPKALEEGEPGAQEPLGRSSEMSEP